MSEAWKIGDVIETPFGLYWHQGVVIGFTFWNEPVLASNSARGRGVIYQTLSEFCGNQIYRRLALAVRLPIAQIRKRAFSVTRGYDAANWNCEHFVRYCLGLYVESPQFAATAALAVGALAVWVAAAA